MSKKSDLTPFFFFVVLDSTTAIRVTERCAKARLNHVKPHITIHAMAATQKVIKFLNDQLPNIAIKFKTIFKDAVFTSGFGSYDILGKNKKFLTRDYSVVRNGQDASMLITEFRTWLYEMVAKEFGKQSVIKSVDPMTGDAIITYTFGAESVVVRGMYHGKGNWLPHISIGELSPYNIGSLQLPQDNKHVIDKIRMSWKSLGHVPISEIHPSKFPSMIFSVNYKETKYDY